MTLKLVTIKIQTQMTDVILFVILKLTIFVKGPILLFVKSVRMELKKLLKLAMILTELTTMDAILIANQYLRDGSAL